MKKTITLLLLLSCVFYLKATDAVLKHSYSFNDGAKDAPGSGVTAVDGTLNGGGTISNGIYTNTTDGYISFDGSALAINTYSGITMEAYIQASNGLNGDDWVMLTNFGTGDQNILFMSNTRGGWIGTTAFAVGGGKSVEIAFFPKKDDGSLHHMVQVLSNNIMKLYFDGVLLDTKIDAPSVADIGTTNATLGWPVQWPWVPKWKGSVTQFNIYDGELTGEQVAANAQAFFLSTGNNSINQDNLQNISYTLKNNQVIINNTINDGQDAKVIIYNTLGRIQYIAKVQSGISTINLPTIAGVYIVELSKSGNNQTFKAVVK